MFREQLHPRARGRFASKASGGGAGTRPARAGHGAASQAVAVSDMTRAVREIASRGVPQGPGVEHRVVQRHALTGEKLTTTVHGARDAAHARAMVEARTPVQVSGVPLYRTTSVLQRG